MMPTKTQTMILNQTQTDAVNAVAKAELRTPEQMLSLLLAEAFRFYFMDYEPPNGSINTTELEESLTADAHRQVGVDA